MPILTTPLKMDTLDLKNRLVFPSVASSTADTNGKVTDETFAFFNERTKGFGLTILEHAYVSLSGKAGPHMLSISDDSDMPGLEKLVHLLHRNDSKAFIQLDHGGGWSIPDLQNCLNPQKNPDGKLITDHLTDMELEQIVEDFSRAANRARNIGFDGVEIKACHVYLLSQFYSPLTNHRTSGKYAGTSFDSRLQLTLDVLQAVRDSVGKSFPVSVRFSIQDYDENGSSLDEGIKAARLLEDNGATFLDLSGGPKHRFFHPFSKEPGWFAYDAYAIRQNVSIPVMVTGGITEPAQAETILEKEKADLIGVCRAVLKNPAWAQSMNNL